MISLQESINKEGIKVPLIVRKIGNGKFELIDGFSRFGCVTTDVPCRILGETGIVMINKNKISTRRYKK